MTHYAEILDRYVRPTIGSKRLDRLSVLDVQRMVAQLELDVDAMRARLRRRLGSLDAA